jgi:hypothetical protein
VENALAAHSTAFRGEKKPQGNASNANRHFRELPTVTLTFEVCIIESTSVVTSVITSFWHVPTTWKIIPTPSTTGRSDTFVEHAERSLDGDPASMSIVDALATRTSVNSGRRYHFITQHNTILSLTAPKWNRTSTHYVHNSFGETWWLFIYFVGHARTTKTINGQ